MKIYTAPHRDRPTPRMIEIIKAMRESVAIEANKAAHERERYRRAIARMRIARRL